ncbi:MAG: YiiX/YebB-like N1pC/P60 family cysteine hydrolase, partial [Patescibacteria group bacterium]
MKNIKLFFCLAVLFFIFFPLSCRAMPPGTLLYRTTDDGRAYGYSTDVLIDAKGGIIKGINPGHVAIYIGQENGEDYIIEALADGLVKMPARYFINSAVGEEFIGAKIPVAASPIQRAKAVALAKSLASKNLGYDFDFKHQKGPDSGEWTCVGLVEKIYESADIANPNNLGALEYDSDYYAVDITPDGFDNYSVINERGDCFSHDKEFSRIARRTDFLLPAPELIGFDAGLEYNGERYIFLPYTQFLQDSLTDVELDIEISSSFDGDELRGRAKAGALVLRWSLINNPLSSLKNIALKTGELAKNIGQKLFGSSSATAIVLDKEDGGNKNSNGGAAKTVSAEKEAAKTPLVTVNKADPQNKSNLKNISASQNDSQKPAAAAALYSPLAIRQASVPAKTADVVSAATTSIATATTTTTTSVISIAPSSPSGAAEEDDYPKYAIINQIYSTGNNDWVRLYNPGENDFDLAAAGYRLEKTKTADDPGLIMRIGNPADGAYPGGTVIAAHDYYLIVRDDANEYYKNQADAIAIRNDFSWTASGYTLYLGTGAISSSADQDIVDAVGFGADATYFLGNGPAPEIVDNYILNRLADNSDNSIDFDLILSDDPSIIIEDVEENATSTDDVATSTEDIATSTPEIIDDEEDAEEPTEENEPVEVPKLALINKIYATGNNDWLELYNLTDYDFDLAEAGYRLEKTKTAQEPGLIMRIGNTEDGLYPGGTIIKARESYLIVRDDANDYYKEKADAIAT